MRIWTLGYDKEKKDNFPQVLYKGEEIDICTETKLLRQLFKIFYLTHRDKREAIKIIEKNARDELPYSYLLELIVPGIEMEFETEYLVELLNYFSIEINSTTNKD